MIANTKYFKVACERSYIVLTINKPEKFFVYYLCDLQDFRYCHPSLLLSESVQPLQGSLNIALAQKPIQVFS